MIYTSAIWTGKTYPRVVPISDIKDKRVTVTVLNGMFIDGVLQKTGPYCPIRYEAPEVKRYDTYRKFMATPASGREITDYRGRGKRRRW